MSTKIMFYLIAGAFLLLLIIVLLAGLSPLGSMSGA